MILDIVKSHLAPLSVKVYCGYVPKGALPPFIVLNEKTLGTIDVLSGNVGDEVSLSVWFTSKSLKEIGAAAKDARAIITDRGGVGAEFNTSVHQFNQEAKVHELTQFYTLIINN